LLKVSKVFQENDDFRLFWRLFDQKKGWKNRFFVNKFLNKTKKKLKKCVFEAFKC